MSSIFLFAGTTPYVTATAVFGISLTFVTLFQRLSPSNASKSPTTAFGWLKQKLGWHLSFNDGCNATPAAIVIRSGGQHRRRRPASSALDRSEDLQAATFSAMANYEARREETDNKIVVLQENVAQLDNRVFTLEKDNAENKREIGIHRTMLKVHHDEIVKSNVMHDESNKRHKVTEGEMKVLQKNVYLITQSLVVIIAIMAAVASRF